MKNKLVHNHQLNVRVSEQFLKKLSKKAKEHEMTISNYIRWKLML